MNPGDARELLVASFHAALAAVDPMQLVPRFLPAPPGGHTLVAGGGKAAASMARALEDHWPADAPLTGLVVTRYRHGLPTRRIEVVEASHPLPDGRGAAAAQRMLEMTACLDENDLLLALISGGGSSLLALPVAGVSLRELRRVTRALLDSGATIQDINTVRKHLTRLSGGQLARAANGAQVCALILSDVPGDDPGHIASAPCAPDPTTYADALAVLAHFHVPAPESVLTHLQCGVAGAIADTPKPGDPCFARVNNHVIAGAQNMLQAAADFFHQRGIKPVIVNAAESGPAREVAQCHATLVRAIRADASRHRPPLALLSGGETTVAVHGPGRGGRNTEYLLALALELDDMEDIYALACDTDGIDGTEDNAGALLTPDSLRRARAAGLDAAAHLAANDAYGFFSALHDVIVTGPTRTNVNDYRVIVLV